MFTLLRLCISAVSDIEVFDANQVDFIYIYDLTEHFLLFLTIYDSASLPGRSESLWGVNLPAHHSLQNVVTVQSNHRITFTNSAILTPCITAVFVTYKRH